MSRECCYGKGRGAVAATTFRAKRGAPCAKRKARAGVGVAPPGRPGTLSLPSPPSPPTGAPMSRTLLLLAVLSFSVTLARADEPAGKPVPLPGTKPLTLTGDIASQMIEGVDQF